MKMIFAAGLAAAALGLVGCVAAPEKSGWYFKDGVMTDPDDLDAPRRPQGAKTVMTGPRNVPTPLTSTEAVVVTGGNMASPWHSNPERTAVTGNNSPGNRNTLQLDRRLDTARLKVTRLSQAGNHVTACFKIDVAKLAKKSTKRSGKP